MPHSAHSRPPSPHSSHCALLDALLQAPVPPSSDAFPTEMRKRALHSLAHLPLPSHTSESWRFFDLRPFLNSSPTVADPHASTPVDSLLASTQLPEASQTTFVILNGTLRLDLSVVTPSPAFNLTTWAKLSEDQQTTFRSQLQTFDNDFPDDFFALFNSAALESVTTLRVAADQVVEPVFHVLYLSDNTAKNSAPRLPCDSPPMTMAHPRLLISLEPGSKATVVEEWISLGETNENATDSSSGPFVNTATQVTIAANASLNHIRLQRHSLATLHMDRLSVVVYGGARYDALSLGLGSRSARSDLHLSLVEPHAWARLNGVALASGTQEMDTHSVITNASPQVTSHQLHKILAAEKSHGVFNGSILVKPGAQEIKAYQLNRNLIIGEKAKVDAKPQLEIFADDVECSHGSATGQLDDDQIFYLETRGLSHHQASILLSVGFISEVLDQTSVPSLRKRLLHEAEHRIASKTAKE